MDVEFNLQQFLSEMRLEQQQGFQVISTRMDKVAADLATHELDEARAIAALDNRLSPLEEFRNDIRWVVGGSVSACGLAVLGLLVDFFKNHWGR